MPNIPLITNLDGSPANLTPEETQQIMQQAAVRNSTPDSQSPGPCAFCVRSRPSDYLPA